MFRRLPASAGTALRLVRLLHRGFFKYLQDYGSDLEQASRSMNFNSLSNGNVVNRSDSMGLWQLNPSGNHSPGIEREIRGTSCRFINWTPSAMPL